MLLETSRLLCISNGHGEDAIALRILAALRDRVPELELVALPIVGEGTGFLKQNIPVIAAAKSLPSGGFIYMDSRQLVRDLKGGLVQLTLNQLQALKGWAAERGSVLAVGDLVPMAFAWWSGLPYAIVGTAKSAYYLRTEAGPLPGLPWYQGWAGSVYLPWERWLMTHHRCCATVVRDGLTAQELQTVGVEHVYTGNPMMDGLTPTGQLGALASQDKIPLTVVLLPGSRAPEAYSNWQKILAAADSVLQQCLPKPVRFLGAIAPALDMATFHGHLRATGWETAAIDSVACHRKQNGSLYLRQTAYADCLHLADVAIAMAGTATEQFVGLGKPAFIMPGEGPQFTPTFAQLQTRLLGPSVILVESPAEIGSALAQVLTDSQRLATIRSNGQRRMGPPGAADAIAKMLCDRLR